MGIVFGRNVKVSRGVSVDVTVNGIVGVLVIVGISVIVEVKVCEAGTVAVDVGVCEGRSVIVGVCVGVGIAARIAEPVALTEETTCVTISTKAIRPATIPRDASDWLR